MAMKTGTGMDFFYHLPLLELFETVRETVEIMKEVKRHGGKKQ